MRSTPGPAPTTEGRGSWRVKEGHRSLITVDLGAISARPEAPAHRQMSAFEAQLPSIGAWPSNY